MKVLHICYMDGQGGAALGAYGLHRAMLAQGVESTMLVIKKTTNDPTVIPVNNLMRRARNWMRKIELRLLKMQKTPNVCLHTLNVFPTGIHRLINNYDADIVQLHWINSNTISIGEISRIKKAVVWKMPDMWAFSGAEHYTFSDDPKRYKEGYIKSNRAEGSGGIDLDRWIWLYKRYRWKNTNISIVGTSNWIAQCVRDSVLFNKRNIRVINNPINLDMFKPQDKHVARHTLKLSQSKRIVLFGSWHVERDMRKGFDKLLHAMRHLCMEWDQDEILLLVFGADRKPDLTYTNISDIETSFEERYLGELTHGDELRTAYCAADVYVTPSLLEGFGLTAAESLACGTPVVCFDTSGLRDIVDHKINGYLAKCYEAEDIARGITWVLRHDSDKLSRSARDKAVEKFDKSRAVSLYLDYYREILGEQ